MGGLGSLSFLSVSPSGHIRFHFSLITGPARLCRVFTFSRLFSSVSHLPELLENAQEVTQCLGAMSWALPGKLAQSSPRRHLPLGFLASPLLAFHYFSSASTVTSAIRLPLGPARLCGAQCAAMAVGILMFCHLDLVGLLKSVRFCLDQF